MLHAVLTGDIVNSTLLDAEQEKKLLKELQTLLSPYKYEFFRGDSFQVYLPDASGALKISLLCRITAIALMPENSPVTSDIRISVGIGEVKSPVTNLATAKGEAFLLSGRALDNLEKTEGRLIITTHHEMGSVALSILSDYVNSIYKQVTSKQAEVILELLQGNTQQQVAEKLNRSKSTISQHVTAGRWDELEKILENYQKIIRLLTI
jgi:hypothetical protein